MLLYLRAAISVETMDATSAGHSVSDSETKSADSVSPSFSVIDAGGRGRVETRVEQAIHCSRRRADTYLNLFSH